MTPTAPTTSSVLALRRSRAMDIVQLHTALCAGANFIPIPILDSLAVSAVQLKMITALSRHYGADFELQKARAIAAALGIGFAQEAVRRTRAAFVFGNWVANIPVIGVPLRHLGWPAILAAYTYILGKAYVEHYEAGGQFADFKPPGLLNTPVTAALR